MKKIWKITSLGVRKCKIKEFMRQICILFFHMTFLLSCLISIPYNIDDILKSRPIWTLDLG